MASIQDILALCAANGWMESLTALELESGFTLDPLLAGAGVKAARRLALTGRWGSLLYILEGGDSRSNVGGSVLGTEHAIALKAAVYTIRRQQYLELLSFDPATSTHVQDQFVSRSANSLALLIYFLISLS